MDDTQLLRYSRHLLLDEIGIDGQEKLNRARALIIGAGGLGSPVALYLAAAGVGHITLCDHDQVDLTNLQRQIAHDTASLGVNKAESAAVRMRAMNPDIEVVPLPLKLAGEALLEQVALADVVLRALAIISRHVMPSTEPVHGIVRRWFPGRRCVSMAR